MNRLPKGLVDNRLIRYIFVGGVSYAIELLLIYGLVYLGNISSLLAVGVAFWVGLVVSFALQKIVAFRDTRTEVKAITSQSFGYGLLVLFNYGFTLLFVHFFIAFTSDDYLVVARTIALIITTIWNFFVYKNILFKTSG